MLIHNFNLASPYTFRDFLIDLATWVIPAAIVFGILLGTKLLGFW